MFFLFQNALFESDHYDQNDVKSISHKCCVLPYDEFQKIHGSGCDDTSETFYFAGDYDPRNGMMLLAVGVELKD